MEEIRVTKVGSRKEMKDFISLPKTIYRNFPQYVPEFESDVRGLFDVKTNPGLEFSEIQPFVAYRGKQPVGRIVGIVNNKANKKWQMKNVRFSMIEFIDDHNVSRALIEAVEEWGLSFGMQKIHGPLGVTDFDKEGMLVEDFDLMGSMTAIYNPPYYPKHMEALGFEKEVDWQQIRIDIPEEVPAKYARVAQYARETIGLRVVKCSKREIRGEYGQRAFKLFNQAYEPIFGFSELPLPPEGVATDRSFAPSAILPAESPPTALGASALSPHCLGAGDTASISAATPASPIGTQVATACPLSSPMAGDLPTRESPKRIPS